jgi:hypothetical protein
MQGFHALGWDVYTNGHIHNGLYSRGISTPYAIAKSGYLNLVGNNELLHDILVVDVSHGYGDNLQTLSKIAESRPVVVVNMEDTTNFWDAPECFIAFTAHFNRLATREGRIFPLGIGLSDDIIELANAQYLGNKRNVIVRNFNATFSQSVRNALDLVLVEGLEKYFEVDRRNSTPEQYLQQLSSVNAVCAYGGEFIPDYWGFEYLRAEWEKQGQFTYKFKYMGATPVVLRWDSWRYFESAVMACAPIQLDFDKYGFVLPVNPEPWVHYIPVDLSYASNIPHDLSDRVSDDPEYLTKIGRNARQWVLENYSPSAQAKYVLSVIDSL